MSIIAHVKALVLFVIFGAELERILPRTHHSGLVSFEVYRGLTLPNPAQTLPLFLTTFLLAVVAKGCLVRSSIHIRWLSGYKSQ